MDFSKRHCCYINPKTHVECNSPAVWKVDTPPFRYDSYTECCNAHLTEMKGDGDEVTAIYKPEDNEKN